MFTENPIPPATPFIPHLMSTNGAPVRRGPKTKAFSNLLHRHLQIAVAEGMQWFDEYVHGACATVAKAHNGVFRVSPSDVLRVCLIPVITTETVQGIILNHEFDPVSADHARRIAQTARFALGGMSLYLENNTGVYDALDREVQFILSYGPFHGKRALAA